ncbi:MAG: ATP-grasp domain-containing protein, partial [Myxococcota bacterium]
TQYEVCDRFEGPLAFHGDVDSGIQATAQGRLMVLEPPVQLLSRVSAHHLKRLVRSMTLEQARAIRHPAFIKPAAPEHKRLFDAGVYRDGRDIRSRGRDEQVLVLCSEPLEWLMEVRCFVAHGQVRAMAMYQQSGRWYRCGEPRWPMSQAFQAHVQGVVAALMAEHGNWIPPGVVLDVGLLAERGWALVEANPAWSATLYGSDVQGVLDTLACCTRTPETLLDHEKRWLAVRTDRPLTSSDINRGG